MAARMPMIATTIISAIRLKPLWFLMALSRENRAGWIKSPLPHGLLSLSAGLVGSTNRTDGRFTTGETHDNLTENRIRIYRGCYHKWYCPTSCANRGCSDIGVIHVTGSPPLRLLGEV